MRGFWDSRSEEQAEEEVMFEAKEERRSEQTFTSTAHETSRAWVIRTTDLEAWKKELEFWRSMENGRQDLKVLLVSMEVMNAWHGAVMLLLKPTSNGVGRAVAAVTMVVDVAVADDVCVEEEEEEIERFLRPS